MQHNYNLIFLFYKYLSNFCRTYCNEVIINSDTSDKQLYNIIIFIRNIYSQLELPIIVINEILDEHKEEQLFNIGTTCIINKPFTKISLISRIKNMILFQQTSEQLKLSEAQQKTIFENSPIPSLIIDKEGIIVNINKKARELFNITEGLNFHVYCGEVFNCSTALNNIGKCGTLEECCDCIIRTTINKTIQNKAPVTHREGKFTVYANNEQQERIIIITSTLINNLTSDLSLLTFEDVTDARITQKIIKDKNLELEQANHKLENESIKLINLTENLEIANADLAENEKKYRAIFEGASEGIIVAETSTGNLLYANPAFCNMFNYANSEIKDLNYKNLHPENFIKETSQRFKNIVIEKNRILKNNPCLKKDGTLFYTNISDSIVWFDGKMSSLAFFTDVTQQFYYEQIIKESEEKFRAIFDYAYDGILLADADTKKFELGNNMICKMLGYEKDEITKLSVYDIHPKEDIQTVLDIFENQLNEKVRIQENLQVKRKDGSIFYADINSSPVKIAEKIYLLGIFRDTTERNRAQKALRDSEEKYKRLFDNSQNLILEVDADSYKIISCNPYLAKRLNLPISEIEGKNIKDFFDEKVFKIREDNCLIALKENKTIEFEDTRNGRYFLNTVTPIINNDKRSILSVSLDITERRIAEEAQKESKKKLKQAQQVGNVGHWEFNIPQNQLFWSEQTYRIYEQNPETFEITFNNVINLFHKDDKQLVIDEYYKSIETKTEFEITHRIVTPNNNIKYITERASTTYDENGIPVSSLGTVLDVTKLKLAEIALLQSEAQLKELNATKDKFFSIIAHDLKNPFNIIFGYSELLSKNIKKYDLNKIESQVNQIYNISKLTYNLLEDLLTWSKSQSGKLNFEPVELNFIDICIEIIEILKSNADAKNIKINFFEMEKIHLKADYYMLKTVFRNLITNAIKFTQPEGRIDIYAEKKHTNVIITVSDNGIGIPKEHHEKLFDVAQKYSTPGTANESGTGLGLALCKEFIEKHGGKIWVESEPEKGSDFKFTLPL